MLEAYEMQVPGKPLTQETEKVTLSLMPLSVSPHACLLGLMTAVVGAGIGALLWPTSSNSTGPGCRSMCSRDRGWPPSHTHLRQQAAL